MPIPDPTTPYSRHYPTLPHTILEQTDPGDLSPEVAGAEAEAEGGAQEVDQYY